MTNYVMSIFYRLYCKLYNYIFWSRNNINKNELVTNYEDFKKNDIAFSKVIFSLNNLQDIVFKILIKGNENVCQKPFHIYFENDKESYNNLEGINNYLNDDSINYIYIRINLVNKKNIMNHVNCIIIDKTKGFVLYFEPMANLRINLDIIRNIMLKYNVEYKLLTPKDIGYSYNNRL